MSKYTREEKLQIKVLDTKEEQEHFHQDIELLYILEGSMEVILGDKTTQMKADDILIINANKKHQLFASSNILFAKLLITYELVSDIFQNANIIFWCDSTKDENEKLDELRKVLKQLLNHYLSTKGETANFGHIALCYQIMDLLSINFLVQTADKENLTEEDKFEYRIQQINNYIRTNYNQPISLKDLAEKLYLSNGYLSRFFKKNYGMSFAEHLSKVRLYHAVDELLYTNIPITRIAYDNGFASVAIFNKSFKKNYGKTPSEMRKKSQKEKIKVHEEAHSAITDRLEQFLQMDGLEQEKECISGIVEANHSMAVSKPMNFVWKQLINGGSAADLLKSEVREHIILLKEALGFEYVRFWNVFSEHMLIDITVENENYNFSRLDSILDFFVQQGIKPHFELGQKPRRIQKNVQNLLVFENESVIFQTISQWKLVIHAFMKHIVNRYGREETDCWKIELWYDERYLSCQDSVASYFELFDQTYEIIRKYSSKIEIGGCGFQIDYSKIPEETFLIQWKEQKHLPDYISCMYFAYERGKINQDIYSKRSTDNEGLIHKILKMKEYMLHADLANKKLYVTEWNLTISDRNFLNDTCFKGAYLIKNVLDIYDKVDNIGYFLGSDRVAEYYDTRGLLFGGTGLITKDGILKPSGFAIEFLNRLYSNVIAKGENYLITTDEHNSYGIICHNQKKLNYNYYFIKEDEVEKEHIWKYFEDRDTLEIHMKLDDLEDGSYKIKTYRINEQSGCVLSIWGEMDYEKELSRNDIKYFRRVCEPKLNIQKYEVMEGSIDFSMKLAPNEIAYIKISKQL